jgi:hypothetical protein
MTATDQTDRVAELAQLLLSQKHFAGLVLLKPEALAIARFLDSVQNDGGRHARAEIPENGQELSRLYTEVSLLREKNRDLTERLEPAQNACGQIKPLIRDSSWNSKGPVGATLDKALVVGAALPEPEAVVNHVEIRICRDPNVREYRSVAPLIDQSSVAIVITSQGHSADNGLADLLANIAGISQAILFRHKVLVLKEALSSWDEVEAGVLSILCALNADAGRLAE